MKWQIVIVDSKGKPVQTQGPFASEERANNYQQMYYPGSGIVVPNIEVLSG
jgi:hypothetical protein